jgi:hypothetical protein
LCFRDNGGRQMAAGRLGRDMSSERLRGCKATTIAQLSDYSAKTVDKRGLTPSIVKITQKIFPIGISQRRLIVFADVVLDS